MSYAGIIAALFLCSGVFFSEKTALPAAVWLSFAAASAIGVFFLRRRTKVCLALICLCAFAAGGLRLYYAQAAYEALPRNLAGTVQKLKLCINEKKGAYETDKGKETKYIADLLEPGGRGRIYLTVKGDDPYGPGAVVEGNLRLKELTLYKNEGSYDFFHYYRRKAVFLRTREKKSGDVRLVAEATGYEAYVGNMRRKITDSFKQTLTDTDAYMLTSLLFGGHYDKLPPELLQSFSTTGMIHILSVSGSHVTLLLALMQCLGKAVGLRQRRLLLLSALFVGAYSALSDFTVPVIRSALMGLVSACALTVKREYTALHALGLIMSAMVLYEPYIAYDLSFRLSCGAAGGIVLFSRSIRQRLEKLPGFLADSLSVCAAANILLIPLLTEAFAVLPAYTFLANLFVGTVLEGLIVLGLAAAVMSFIAAPAAHVILLVLKPLLHLAVGGNYFLAALPYSRLPVGAMSFYSVCAYALVVAGLFWCKFRKPCLLLACAFAAFGAGLWYNQKDDVKVYVFDVGADRATCAVDTAGQAYLWYNKSRTGQGGVIASVLVPAMRHAGIFTLAGAVVEGADTDKTAAEINANFSLKGSVEQGHGKENTYIFADTGRPYVLLRGSNASVPPGAVGEVYAEGLAAGDVTADFLILSGRRHAYVPGEHVAATADCGEMKIRRHKNRWYVKTCKGDAYEIR